MKKVYQCKSCKSDDLVWDALVDENDKVITVLDNCFCNNCGNNIKFEKKGD